MFHWKFVECTKKVSHKHPVPNKNIQCHMVSHKFLVPITSDKLLVQTGISLIFSSNWYPKIIHYKLVSAKCYPVNMVPKTISHKFQCLILSRIVQFTNIQCKIVSVTSNAKWYPKKFPCQMVSYTSSAKWHLTNF